MKQWQTANNTSVISGSILFVKFFVCCKVLLCMQGNFAGCFCSLLLLFFFSKLTFSKNSFRNTICVSKHLDPDQDPTYCNRPDVGPKCFAKVISGLKLMRSKIMSF